MKYEKQKVSGAVRTDFILSAEIMAIALGTVSTKPIWGAGAVLAINLAITVFVYGLRPALCVWMTWAVTDGQEQQRGQGTGPRHDCPHTMAGCAPVDCGHGGHVHGGGSFAWCMALRRLSIGYRQW